MGSFELREVSKVYSGQAALSKVSATFDAGEHTAIIGVSGSGKSTLLRLLAGLEPPTAGEIFLDGELVSASDQVLRPPHHRKLSMVFQDLALWPNLSALENVLLGLSASGLSKSERKKRAFEVLALCSIEALSDRKPGVLSGGEQQRVALARALVARPAFLLLDEPFAGLDLVTKLRLLGKTLSLASEQGATLVLVTHDPLEAKQLCRQAIVLRQGSVEESGSLEELLRSPRSEILRRFANFRW